MTLSSKSRYALEIMTDLAEHRDKLVSVSAIAKRRRISEKYAEQIMSILKRAGFVTSERGAYGGYRLAASPDNYRAGDILRLMDSKPSGVKAEARGAAEKLEEAIGEVVDGFSIADLMSERQ